MVEIKLTATLFKDRHRLGTLTMAPIGIHTDGQGNPITAPIVICHCLGISDNAQAIAHHNPARNPLLPFGDTPTGIYQGTIIPPGDLHGFGQFRRIFLTPVSGDGVKAESAPNNRAGLLIHGGELNPLYTWWEGLRPTFGCLRVPDDGMKRVLDVVDQNQGAGIGVEILEL